MGFPIDLSAFKPVVLQRDVATLSAEQAKQLADNVALCRDALVFFTAVADAQGLGGHTGGAYDIVPEVLIADGFMRGSDDIVSIYFDEAGHRVAMQYLMSVLNGELDAERLLHYREAGSKLPGHPERDFTPGVKFSSGRLGHMWPYVNGVALANPGKAVFMFGSDGSQQEGNNAEAARLAVARGLNVKLVIDDNDVTIAGHPSEYMKGFDVAKTLEGHGVPSNEGDGEDLVALHGRMQQALQSDGPVALVNKRKMAVGIPDIEGLPKGHDVIKVPTALKYLEARGGLDAAIAYLKGVQKPTPPGRLRGTGESGKNRDMFGRAICRQLEKLSREERINSVVALDSDLEGSCGMNHIRANYPEVFISGGIMERSNYSAAAGFGRVPGRQGIFATFSAFLEMVVSEITMARLNESNVLAHFSHAGVDYMADNTCHFGLNNFFAAGGLSDANDHTRLYFPADVHQMNATIDRIYGDPGLRFVFSTRSATAEILKEDGSPFYGDGYAFEPDKDEVIREGSAGYVVSYGEMLSRCLDAVERARAAGVDVGLIAKPTLNVVDEAMLAKAGASPFVLVVESQNRDTGLGVRYGSWLLERGHGPRYARMGTTKLGDGGLWEHLIHQGLDSDAILAQLQSLHG